MGARLISWLPAISLMALIAWLSHDPRPPVPVSSPDWLLHGLAYGALALAAAFGAADGLRRIARDGAPWIGGLVASVYGIVDEVHQSFVPGRDPSLLDWVADVAGAVLVALALTAWALARDRHDESPST